LNVIRETVSHANYLKFKKLISAYRKDEDLMTLFNGLSQFLLVNQQSREILKSFHRFFGNEEKERFIALVKVRFS